MPAPCLKKLNQQNFELFNLVEAAIFALERDSDGRVIYTALNTHAREVLDTPADSLIGRTAAELLPGRLGQLAYKRHVKAMEDAVPVTYEISLPHKGSVIHIRTTLQPTFDEQGRVQQMIGTSHEVTAETAVRALQIDSQALDSEMEQFVNLAAHDLRAPMRNVNLLTAMLKDGFQDLGDGKLEIINILESVTKNTQSLIGDVLKHADCARVQKNDPTEFELEPLFQEIIAVLDPTGTHIASTINCDLVGDRTVTQIVLRNLIDNAIKHNKELQLKLSLSVGKTDVPAGFYQLTVEDNGAGFPDSTRAFLENKSQSTINGGFGLMGVRRLVNTRGGSISAANLSNGGAAITFTLPGQLLSAA